MTKSKQKSSQLKFPATIGIGSLNLSLSRHNHTLVQVDNPIQDKEKASGLNKKDQTYSCNLSAVCTISKGRNCTATTTSSSCTFSPTLHVVPSSTSIPEEERSDLRKHSSTSTALQKQKTHTTTKDVEHNTSLNHSPGTQAVARNPVQYLKQKRNKIGVLEDNQNLSSMKTSTPPTCTTSSVISTALKTGIRAGEKHSLDVNESRQLKKRSTRPTCTAECPICMRVFHTTVSDISRLPFSLICISSYRSKTFYNCARAVFWLLPATIDEILDRDQSTYYEMLRPTRAHGVKSIKITR
jgi:hypothetical protein